jgi:hypothetical protein
MAEAGGAAERPQSEIVRLLESALAPIEPPAQLADELEAKLVALQAAAIDAVEELTELEVAEMRDPRNWVRPAAAVAVGTAAGAALLVLRMRHARRRRGGLPGIANRMRRDAVEVISEARQRIR